MQNDFSRLFLAVAVIFSSRILYEEDLMNASRIIFDVLLVIFGIIAFIFPDVDFWSRIWIVIVVAIAGILFHILWRRLSKRIIIRSPIALRKDRPDSSMVVVSPRSVLVNSRDNNNPRSWYMLLKQTNFEILIQGITLESLNRVRPSIEAAAKSNKKLKILFCDPHKDKKLMDEIDDLVVSTTTDIRILSSVAMLNLLRNGLGSSDRANIEIRWHDKIPTMSLVIIDPNSDSGLMQIEPYPYRTPQENRKIFEITRQNHKEVFNEYLNAFYRLWNSAQAVP